MPRPAAPRGARSLGVHRFSVLCLTISVTLAPMVVASAQSGDGVVSSGDGAELLRQGWILHRFEGEMEGARQLYLQVYDEVASGSDQAAIDLRARAAIGLALLAREEGLLSEARRWLHRALRNRHVSPRWIRNANDVLTQIDLEEGDSERRLLGDQKREIARLEEELTALTDEVNERDEELQRRDELIRRIESRLDPDVTRRPPVEVEKPPARSVSTLEERERESEALKRYFIETALDRVREYYHAGRYLYAHNELKKVLEIAPFHPEATELSRRCAELIRAIAATDQSDALPGVGRQARAKGLVLEAMRNNLDTGRRRYREGDVAGATAALQQVMKEYTYCPALSDDEIASFVQPARRLLLRCYDESGVGDEALALKGKQDVLRVSIREGVHRLLDQELALEEVHSEIERIKQTRPDEALAYVRSEVSRLTARASSAAEGEQTERAIAAYRDIAALIDWFPEVDLDGRLAARVQDEIRILAAALESEAAPADGEIVGPPFDPPFERNPGAAPDASASSEEPPAESEDPASEKPETESTAATGTGG